MRNTPATSHLLTALLLLTAITAARAQTPPPSRTQSARASGNHPALAWSTYLGGGYDDEGMDVTVDAAGNAYISGSTLSEDFPGGAGMLGGWDAFVTKIDPQGKLVFTRFLGGSWFEWARGVAVDASGSIYLAGFTASTEDFPGGASGRLDREGDAFVAKLDPTGSQVLWARLLGGESGDEATDIALDAAGNVYVVGETASPDFPWTRRLPSSTASGLDLFVARLSPADGSVVWATGIGGSGDDRARRIAVASAGRIVFTAVTESSDFPWVNTPRPAVSAPLGVVAKLDPSGSSLVWSRSLGNEAAGLAVDAAGNAWVTGMVWTDLPLVKPLQSTRSGWSDAFVAQLGPAGNVLFSTYLGGREGEGGTGIALGPSGNVWVTGDTSSPDFPLRHPIQAACTACQQDAFVAEIDPRKPELLFSTRFGGSVGVKGDFGPAPPNEAPASLAVDARGGAILTGWTYSINLPMVRPVQPRHAATEAYGGTADAFAARIASSGGNRPPVCAAAVANPATLWPANGRMTRIAIGGVTDPEGEAVTLSVTRVTQDEPRRSQAPDATGIGSSAPSVRASRSGTGDGRVYHLTFTATDAQGAACTGKVTVCVPRDAKHRICDDGGGLVGSTRPR